MTMSVSLIEGNILTPPTRNENTIICHQVNCRAAMGAGLARQIRDKWPVVFDEYVKVCSPKKLGDFQVVQVAPQLYVANLFGQLSFGRDKRQTNYAALGTALFRAMKEHPNATFRVPYGLGCGLAGGNWVTVLNLIEEAAELLEAYTAKERSALDCAEEMADVMEVLYAMGKTCAVSKREVEQVRSQKAAEKGTFSKKIFLVSTEK